MKWYAIMMLGLVVLFVVGAAVEKGPHECAEACKASGRTMQSYSLTGGCACGEVRP